MRGVAPSEGDKHAPRVEQTDRLSRDHVRSRRELLLCTAPPSSSHVLDYGFCPGAIHATARVRLVGSTANSIDELVAMAREPGKLNAAPTSIAARAIQ